MTLVNVFEVKARLSEYLDRAASGEHIVICRHNTPVAELRPLEATRAEPRPVGPLPGRAAFAVPPAFFEPLSEEDLVAWEGGAKGDPVSYKPARQKAAKAAESGMPYSAKRKARTSRTSPASRGRKS